MGEGITEREGAAESGSITHYKLHSSRRVMRIVNVQIYEEGAADEGEAVLPLFTPSPPSQPPLVSLMPLLDKQPDKTGNNSSSPLWPPHRVLPPITPARPHGAVRHNGQNQEVCI